MKSSEQKIIDLGGFYTIVHGRDASYMALNTDVYIGQALILYGEYSEIEFRLLKQMCKPGDHIVEIGANIGAHSVRLAKHVGDDGRLVVAEPQPVIFQTLAATMALNSITNVDYWPHALSSQPGVIGLPKINYAKESNYGGIALKELPQGNVPVSVHRFDDIYYYNRLDLMKIDVEGMELDVLKGAEKAIEKYRPKIYLENDREESSEALIQWLFDAGYKVWWHLPFLFNPDNYFKNNENIYGGAASINMIAIHSSTPAQIPLPPVDNASNYPSVVKAPPPETS